MLNVLFLTALPFACSDSEPPPAPPAATEADAEAEPPPPKKRPRSASQVVDTGLDIDDLIEEIRYEPARPIALENLKVVVSLGEIDGFVDVDYAWEVNGRRLISERNDELPNGRFSKDDTVQAFLSIRVDSETVEREAPLMIVGNSPPRILTDPKSLSRLDGFRIRGEDPDGGPITYHVKGGPPGLSIGENTGVVRYKPSKDAEGGSFPITFIVRDQDKAESEWRLSVSVNAGSESASAKAERAKRKEAWEAEQAEKRKQREAESASQGED